MVREAVIYRLCLSVLPILLPEVGQRFAGHFPNPGYVLVRNRGEKFVRLAWCGTVLEG